MRRHTDTFPLFLVLASGVLFALFKNLWENAVQAWLVAEIKSLGYGPQLATVVNRGVELVPTLGLTFAVIYFIYWYVRREFERTEEAFAILPQIYIESHRIESSAGRVSPDLFESIFYLGVGHAKPKGETLKRVQMSIFFHGPPIIARLRHSTQATDDLRHGEFLFFEIGRLVSKNALGLYQGTPTKMDEERLRAFEHNVPRGHWSFGIGSHTASGFGLGSNPGVPQIWPLHLTIAADDAVSKHVSVAIDLLSDKAPVTISSVS